MGSVLMRIRGASAREIPTLVNDHLKSEVELERSHGLTWRSVMVVADDPRDFPRAVFVLPQMNELAFADALCFLVARVAEEIEIRKTKNETRNSKYETGNTKFEIRN
jgi:hypothetical protein